MEILDLKLPNEIIHKYPYPLAIAAARVNDSTENVEKFLALARLAEITLKYLAAISMAQYLLDPDWDEQTQSELQKLPRPSLGVWNSILSGCMALYGSKNRALPFGLPELRDGYATMLGQESPAGQSMLEWTRFVTEYLDGKPGDRQSVSPKEVLDLVVRYQNKTWGYGLPQLTPDFCGEHGMKLAAGLGGLLRAIDYLSRYPLRYVKEVRKVKGRDVHAMFDYMGTTGRTGATYAGEYAEETRLYVCDQAGKPRLCLFPLLVLNERRVYVLDYYEAEPGHRQAGYCDCANGTPFCPERLSIFQMSKLANDKHNKLGDTHIAIPPQEDGLTANDSTSQSGSTVESIFSSALSLKAGERDAHLTGTCGKGTQLRQRVESLLRAYDEGQGVAPEKAGAGASPEAAGQAGSPATLVELTEHSGDRIGRYKLLQQIGEGGMGVVYMAEQQEPVIRKVALKIIKLGMDSRQVVARFEAERQALALMDHPNIAKILDAGATQTGRPFFVMELVRGIKITDYCDQNNIPTEDRLKLFVEVCHAIQHAHQKGIIHRDIKPSNILVTLHDGVPVPKVIDFGIAKATEGRLTDKTLFTEFNQFIGTPAYMSPEQAELSALDIDTRSDIYSLGVLLYELLTSNTPFDSQTLVRDGLDEMRRIIREDEPLKPSTRLGTLAAETLSVVAKKRHCAPQALNKLVRGELDSIVMKALEKDRTRRYDSASAFAQDVERRLNQEPVSAAAPSTLYKFQKLARRHKAALATVTAIAIVLLAGAISSTLLMVRARKAEEAAREQARKAWAAEVISRTEERRASRAEKTATQEAIKSQQIAQFFTDMLKAVEPSVALGRDTRLLRDILNRTVERIGKDLKDQPELEARLRTTVGQVFTDLGEYENAREMFSEALDLRRKLFPKEHADVATSLLNLAYVLRIQHKLSEAEDNCVQALAMRKKLFGEEHQDVATALWHLAHVLGDQDQLVRAEELHRQALAMRRKLLGDQDKDVASSLVGLADVLLSSPEKQGEAATMYRQALDIRMKHFGSPHPAVAASLGGVARAFEAQGNLPVAERNYQDALAMRRKLFVNEHPDVARSLHNLAGVLAAQGRVKGKLAEAEKCFSEALAIRRKLLSSDPSEVAGSLAGLASVLQRQGKLDEAEKVLNEFLTPAVESETRSAGLMRSRANLRARTGRWKEAAADFSKAAQLDPKPTWTWIWFQLAPLLIESGDRKGYDQHRDAMLARFQATTDPRTAERIAKACLLLPMTGADLATASRMADTAVTAVEDRQLAFSQLVKGLAEYRQGRFTNALEWTQKALAKAGNDDQRDAQCHAVLAIAHHQLNQTNEARIALRKAAEIIETKPPKLESGDLTDEWPHWLISQILIREAKTLIGAAPIK